MAGTIAVGRQETLRIEARVVPQQMHSCRLWNVVLMLASVLSYAALVVPHQDARVCTLTPVRAFF